MLVHLLVPYTIMGSGLMTFIINVTCSIIITKYHTVAAIDRQNIIKESYYNFDFNKAIFINIHYNFISYSVYWDIFMHLHFILDHFNCIRNGRH